MWGWIAGALALVLLLLALALLVPVDVSVRRELGERPRARIGWLWDRVAFDVRAKAEDEANLEEDRERKPRRPVSIAAMLQTDGFPSACARCLRRLWRSWRLRELRARLHVGGADPAETGMLAGIVAPLAALAAVGATIEVAPDFERERLEAEGRFAARVWPALALGAAIAFMMTPATWRALRRGWRAA